MTEFQEERMKKTCGCLEVKCHVFYAKQLVIMQLIRSHFAWRTEFDDFFSPCIHINTVIKFRLRCMSPECQSIFVFGYQLDICLQCKSGVILYFFGSSHLKKARILNQEISALCSLSCSCAVWSLATCSFFSALFASLSSHYYFHWLFLLLYPLKFSLLGSLTFFSHCQVGTLLFFTGYSCLGVVHCGYVDTEIFKFVHHSVCTNGTPAQKFEKGIFTYKHVHESHARYGKCLHKIL